MIVANRGFLKDVSGSKRLRIVRAGLDANDMTLLPNQIVFDSDWSDSASILLTGSYNLTVDIPAGAGDPNGYAATVASYASLGGKPLGYAFIKKGTLYTDLVEVNNNFVGTPYIHVNFTATKVLVDCAALNYPATLYFVMYRIIIP